MRRGDTPTARASAVCDSAIGFRKSSSRISPGCGFGSCSVVVDDRDIFGSSFGPVERDTPLVVDADAPLPRPSARQFFQPVSRRHAQIVHFSRRVDQTELAQGDGLYVEGKASAALAVPDLLGLAVDKADDHCFV